MWFKCHGGITVPFAQRAASHLFLAVLDGQLESRQLVVVHVLQHVDVVAEVEDELQLAGAARLVQQVLGELLALARQLLVLRLELVLHLAQLLQLPAELEGGEEGVLAGQGDERGRRQGLVDVEA